MTLIHLVLFMIAVGVLLWAVNTFIPMAAVVKSLLNLLVVVVLVLYILQFFHLIPIVLPFPTLFK